MRTRYVIGSAVLLILVFAIIWFDATPPSANSSSSLALNGESSKESTFPFPIQLSASDEPSHTTNAVVEGPLLGDEETMERFSLAELLARYQLKRDPKFLKKAIERFPNDPHLVTIAALTTSEPDSHYLKELESIQPQNALPHLLKAGLLADKKNWRAAKEQLQLANTKPELFLDRRERQAAALDMLIKDPSLSGVAALYSEPDHVFTRRINSIVQALAKNPDGAFGSQEDAASLELGIAMKLRDISEPGLLSYLYAHGKEMGLLVRLANIDPNYLYGGGTMTVSQRLEQMNARATEIDRFQTAWNAVVSPAMELKTKRQFFARVRADGEIAALKWFEQAQVLGQ